MTRNATPGGLAALVTIATLAASLGGCDMRLADNQPVATEAAKLDNTRLDAQRRNNTRTAALETRAASANNAKIARARFKTFTRERQCLIRAMYFESNRSSRPGLLAVGTVVMNRVDSPLFPNSICGVVGQPNQFAPGVMTKALTSPALPRVEQVADEILAGKRSKGVKSAKFFHTAGLHFPYHNMHYVLVAGGNAFYEKRPWRRREGAEVAKLQGADVLLPTIAPSDKPAAKPPALTQVAAASPSSTMMERFFRRTRTVFSEAANDHAGCSSPVHTASFGTPVVEKTAYECTSKSSQ